jgi:hypothetical protein
MYLYNIATPSTRTVMAVCTLDTQRVLDLIQTANGTTGHEPTEHEVLATAEQRLIEIYEASRGVQGQLLMIGFGEHRTKLMMKRARLAALAALDVLESATPVDGGYVVNLVARPARKWRRTKNSPPIDMAALEDATTVGYVEELLLLGWMVNVGLDPCFAAMIQARLQSYADTNISMAASDLEEFDVKQPMFHKDTVGADIATVLMDRAAQHAARAVRGIQLAGI